jgi:hypothetical protein
MTDRLFALVDGYQYTTLVRIAEFNHIATTTTKGRKLHKNALIEVLCRELFTQKRAMQALARLGDLERAVLDRLLLHGGEVATHVLRDQLQRDNILQPGPPLDRYTPYESDPFNPEADSFEDVIARLTLHGLVLSSGVPRYWKRIKLSFTPAATLIVPKPLRGYLPQPALPSVEWGQGSLPAPIEETSPAISQRELFIYWSYVRGQALPLTQAGLLRKPALRNINQHLLSPSPFVGDGAGEREFPRLHFVRLLLQELGLFILKHNHLQVAGQLNQVPEFWKQSVEDRTKACVKAWLRMKDWSELSSLRLSSFDLDLPRARSTLLEQLRLLPPALSISAERFLSRLSIVAPGLLFDARESLHAATTYSRDSNHTTQQSHRLAEIQGAFVGRALSGPLHWLGILDISADDDRLLAFRIKARGARALHLASELHISGDVELATEDEPGAEAKLIVQPNFQIFALGPVPEATLARLEMFADRVKADRSAFEYALSRETVYRGQQDGVPVGEVIAYLEQTCSVPVPQNVLRTLQEWGEQHERIVFHRAAPLLQTSSPELLEQLWDDTSLRIHLERRVTPTAAVVGKRRLAALQEALLKREMLPAFSAQDKPRTGLVQATPDGELLPIHDGPSILLEARLRRLAEERDAKFYVTEAAVTEALASGMSVLEYLDQLTVLHRGPLPAELQSRIKAWGRYYGKASLQNAVLLEVKDSATAEELLADAELAPLLSRFAADPRGRLLHVHTDDLDALGRLLRDRGVQLT